MPADSSASVDHEGGLLSQLEAELNQLNKFISIGTANSLPTDKLKTQRDQVWKKIQEVVLCISSPVERAPENGLTENEEDTADDDNDPKESPQTIREKRSASEEEAFTSIEPPLDGGQSHGSLSSASSATDVSPDIQEVAVSALAACCRSPPLPLAAVLPRSRSLALCSPPPSAKKRLDPVVAGTGGNPLNRPRAASGGGTAEKEPRGVVGPLKGTAKKAIDSAKGAAAADQRAAATYSLPFLGGEGKQAVKEMRCSKGGGGGGAGGGGGRKRCVAALGGGGGSDTGGGKGEAKRLRDEVDDDAAEDDAGFPMTGGGGGEQNRGAATFVAGECSLLVSDAAGTKPAQAGGLQGADSASVAVGTSQDMFLPDQGNQRAQKNALLFKELVRVLFERCKADIPRHQALKEMMKELQRLRERGDVTFNIPKELLNRARTIVGEDMFKEALATVKERFS